MSIALTTPFTLSGSVTENDTTGGCSGFSVDFIGGTTTFTLEVGTLSGSGASTALVPGTYGPVVTVTMSLVTGAWVAYTQTLSAPTPVSFASGVINGTQVQQFIALLDSIRNGNEQFASGNTVMPGTYTAWPTGSI